MLYERGLGGIARNIIAARHWYERGAEQGDAVAETNLALCTLRAGESDAAALALAAKAVASAAGKGYSMAVYAQGVLHEHGHVALGFDVDVPKAVRCYTSAARAGLREAQFRLAVCIEDGAEAKLAATGAPPTARARAARSIEEAALRAYLDAAEQGHGHALVNSALLLRPTPTPTFATRSSMLDAAALVLHEADATNERSMAAPNRALVEQSMERSVEDSMEHSMAALNRALMAADERFVAEEQPANVEAWVRQAGERGPALGMLFLGLMFESGNIVGRSLRSADELYRRCAMSTPRHVDEVRRFVHRHENAHIMAAAVEELQHNTRSCIVVA